MAKTVAILYGFCEGPQRGRRLVAALHAAGLQVISDAQQADVIIAHSGGCFIVPAQRKATTVLLVGVPYHPHGMFRAQCRNIAIDFSEARQRGATYFWQKLLWNTIYLFNMVGNVRMVIGMNNKNIWRLRGGVHVIHNARDEFSPPEDLPFAERPTASTLPGGHDDLWQNPAPYVTSVKSYYGT